MKTVGIIGNGSMGGGIAQTAAQNGYDKVTTQIGQKRTKTQDVETKGFRGNFIYRTLLANGKYYYLSRIGSTLVYATGDEDDKKEINGIMNELGYVWKKKDNS